VETGRLTAENALQDLKNQLTALNPMDNSGADQALGQAKLKLITIRSFLGDVLDAVNKAVGLDASYISIYKADISVARNNLNNAISAITAKQQDVSSVKLENDIAVNAAKSSVEAAEAEYEISKKQIVQAQGDEKTARDRLNALKAGARKEDINLANAQISEINSQIDIVRENINKSTLYAPAAARVSKIWVEEKEFFRPGQIISQDYAADQVSVISLAAIGFKVQADVSELDIGKVSAADGNDVEITLDAFPDHKFTGKILSIDPQEVLKEGDRYFRINVSLEGEDLPVRTGMSADLFIITAEKQSVIQVPAYMVSEKDGKNMVNILENNKLRETEVQTGVSDGEFIEITSGLTPGQTIAITSE
jgi:HlyD family secretion protein